MREKNILNQDSKIILVLFRLSTLWCDYKLLHFFFSRHVTGWTKRSTTGSARCCWMAGQNKIHFYRRIKGSGAYWFIQSLYLCEQTNVPTVLCNWMWWIHTCVKTLVCFAQLIIISVLQFFFPSWCMLSQSWEEPNLVFCLKNVQRTLLQSKWTLVLALIYKTRWTP